MKKGKLPQEQAESTAGEQMDLIDVAPENVKKIIAAAKKYKKAQAEKIAALNEEVNEKQVLLSLINDVNLKPVGGKTQFHCGGLFITVTPRDGLVKVKDESESKDKD